MPSEKDNYMTENNKEFKNLKEAIVVSCVSQAAIKTLKDHGIKIS